MGALPRKMSELLRLAVKDAQTCEADPRYRLSMDDWHRYRDSSSQCHVCMAGAVMAQSLEVGLETSTMPHELGCDKHEILTAIDRMRIGAMRVAANMLQSSVDSPQKIRAMESASLAILDAWRPSLQRASWDAYLRAAEILEGAGL